MKLLWKHLQNATMLQNHGKRSDKRPIKLHLKKMQCWIPNLSTYRFTEAKRHCLVYGRGAPVPSVSTPGMRFSISQVDHFVTFITSTSPIPLLASPLNKFFLPDFVQSSPQYLVKKAFPGFSPGLASTPHISRLHYKIQ